MRHLRWLAPLLALGVGSLAAAAAPATAPPAANFTWGPLDGLYAPGVVQVFGPLPWAAGKRPQTLFVQGKDLLGLAPAQLAQVKTTVGQGAALVVLEADQAAIDRASALVGQRPILGLGGRILPLFALRSGRSFAIEPTLFRREPAALPIASQVATLRHLQAWLGAAGTQAPALSGSAGPGSGATVNLLEAATPFSHTQLWPYQFSYASHSQDNGNWQQCTNNYSLQLLVWPVYVATSTAVNQPTDFFVTQVDAQWDASACFGFYPESESYSSRMAGYYHDTILFSSSVAAYTNDFTNFLIVPGQNSPQSTDPSVATTTGLSWNLGGTGTIGSSGLSGTTSLAFTAGVTFSDQTTVTYPSTQVTNTSTSSKANGAGGPGGSGVAAWAFNFGAPTFPGDLCAGTSMGETAPSSSGSYETQMSWIWQAAPPVRASLGATGLPISLDFSPTVAYRYIGAGPYAYYGVQSPDGIPVDPFDPDATYVGWGVEPRPDDDCFKQQGSFPYPPQPVPAVVFNVPFAPLPAS